MPDQLQNYENTAWVVSVNNNCNVVLRIEDRETGDIVFRGEIPPEFAVEMAQYIYDAANIGYTKRLERAQNN